MSTPVCHDCGATIRWVRTRAGKAMPVNPVPDRSGNVAAVRVGANQYVEARVVTRADPPASDETVFRAHWADCTRGEERTPRPATPQPTQQELF